MLQYSLSNVCFPFKLIFSDNFSLSAVFFSPIGYFFGYIRVHWRLFVDFLLACQKIISFSVPFCTSQGSHAHNIFSQILNIILKTSRPNLGILKFQKRFAVTKQDRFRSFYDHDIYDSPSTTVVSIMCCSKNCLYNRIKRYFFYFHVVDYKAAIVDTFWCFSPVSMVYFFDTFSISFDFFYL